MKRTVAANLPMASGYYEKLYPTTKLEPLVLLLKDRGAPLTALASAGLTETEIASPSTRISIDQVLQVYAEVLRQMSEPDLAFQTGQRFHVTTYGMYGFAMLSSDSLRRALRFAVDYHQLSTPLADCRFIEDGADGPAWDIRPIPHPMLFGPLYEFVVELYLGIFCSLHGELTGGPYRPAFVRLTYTPRSAPGGVPVHRGPENRLPLDPTSLDRPARLRSPAVNRMLVDICNTELEQLKRRTGVAGQVRELLMENACRPLDIWAAAARLNMSERSLRRRLTEEGVSLSELKDELRLQLAIELLRDTRLTMEDIAESLAFSDAASFRRAFRRWTGEAPQDYRDRPL